MSERSTTKKKLKASKATEARTVRYWPTSMVAEIDQPIPFAPCPTASTYPAAGRKVSA